MLNRIKTFWEDNFHNKLETLKELSKDKSAGYYLTSRIEFAYDFDDIAGNDFKSCDALIINSDRVIFIEFKNQPSVRRNKKVEEELKCDIKLKAVESLIVLFNLLCVNKIIKKFWELCQVNKKLIVVYSSVKTENQINKLNSVFRKRLLSASRIEFNLDRYKGSLYNDILTVPDNVFNEMNYPFN